MISVKMPRPKDGGNSARHVSPLRYISGIVTEALFVVLMGGLAFVSMEIARWLGR
jgi:hypothetical protein